MSQHVLFYEQKLSKQKSLGVIGNLDQVQSPLNSTPKDVSTSVEPTHNLNEVNTPNQTSSLSIDDLPDSSNRDNLDKTNSESIVSEPNVQQQLESIVSEPVRTHAMTTRS